MNDFSEWIRKTHPEYFVEADENAIQTQGSDPHASKSSIHTVMPTPADYQNESKKVSKSILDGITTSANNEILKLQRSINAATDANDRNLAIQRLNDFFAFANETYKRSSEILKSQANNMFYCKKIDEEIEKLPKQVFLNNHELATKIYNLQKTMRITKNNKISPVYTLMDMMGQNQNMIAFQFEKLFKEFLDEHSISGKIEEAEAKLKNHAFYIPPVNSEDVAMGMTYVKQAAQDYELIFSELVKTGMMKIPK